MREDIRPTLRTAFADVFHSTVIRQHFSHRERYVLLCIETANEECQLLTKEKKAK
ncbi:hypothetical protein [Geobacillus sp. FJAT-46040]|uniref:hypothetical protein n=1 Tax=Geobacillus TaxID=129337 RepID=UPI0018E9C504|nr:hypothetical protein [Geobacillus sp. FJAT-46040]